MKLQLQTVGLAIGLVTGWLSTLSPSIAASNPVRDNYWWQDELRTVACQVNRARTGAIARWPRMTVPAGSATLPLPAAQGKIVLDGELDEQAWRSASSFPVGPLFGPWRDGPFTVQVSACQDQRQVYLAIQSPRGLTDFGSLTTAGEFVTADRPYRFGKDDERPGRNVGQSDDGRTFELALPLPVKAKPIKLAFSAELTKRVGGKSPPELTPLGLSTHEGPVWLAPFTIQLVPARTAVRLGWTTDDAKTSRLNWQFLGGATDPAAAGQLAASNASTGSVAIYSWQGQSAGRKYHFDAFRYIEPVPLLLQETQELTQRAQALRGVLAGDDALRVARTDVQGRLAMASPDNHSAWRQLYCQARKLRARAHLSMLHAPLLFVKRHPYFAGHIYDDFYTWHPGGGIYVLENPAQLDAKPVVRPIIDPQTNETLGEGVYRDPEISWNGKRIVFANKPQQNAMTSIYEIGIDGTGLRRLTDAPGHHDVTPCYLPDNRIAFLSTRPRALVPCFNSGVATLHTMRADGSGITSISVNNVNEFDPAVLADGRLLYGRWEYVDKTALYMQSLWTALPDGRMETALFANNLPKPTALLDARPVPGSPLVVAALTPHNGQAVGAIATIDPGQGKDNLQAIVNFTPEYPTEMDQGLRTGPCDPWPLSTDDVIISNNAHGAHGILELIDRWGHRELVHAESAISCYAPMLIKPRTVPPTVTEVARPRQPGRFLVLDIYRGLPGVPRGSIKRLRIIEETARTSGIPEGGRWWNQAFLISWQGAYVVKNVLGTVPVHTDGSAYFEVPSDRALYFEAIDEHGRAVQRMRTFVQAAPSVTRSCIGCHERKSTAPAGSTALAALARQPDRPQPESWGSGYIDYATMVQPILDKHCVSCHGGPAGIAGGIDLTGGPTWAFNISYETLLKRGLTGFLRCHNSDVTSSDVLPPRTLGSGSAPLADLLLAGHEGQIPKLTPAERDLLLAWMDGNSNYYGTWDYSPHATCDALLGARGALAGQLRALGCTNCHAAGHIGNDWINLARPEWSRILRAPLAKSDNGLGLAWCRERKASTGLPLVTQRNQPPDVFHPLELPAHDESGKPQATFASTEDAGYQTLLRLIRRIRAEALAKPRIDMLGAQINPGVCRRAAPVPVPDQIPTLQSRLTELGEVALAWQIPGLAVGVEYEIHRGNTADFVPSGSTRIGVTTACRFTDHQAPIGAQHYALVAVSDTQPSQPARATITVPRLLPPLAPTGLTCTAQPGEVALCWDPVDRPGACYEVYRSAAGQNELAKVHEGTLASTTFTDGALPVGVQQSYTVRAVDKRGQRSPLTAAVVATPLPLIKEPVFSVAFADDARGRLLDGTLIGSQVRQPARVVDGVLDLRQGGYVQFAHRPEHDLRFGMSLECWVLIDEPSQMPLVVSCGQWRRTGWFLQRFGRGWRWHVGGIDCDGGKALLGQWTHVLATFDGHRARLYENGVLVADKPAAADRTPWPGPLLVGQYTTRSTPAYQLTGRVAGLKIYRRAVSSDEARAAYQAGH